RSGRGSAGKLQKAAASKSFHCISLPYGDAAVIWRCRAACSSISHRQAQRVVDQEIVVDAAPLGELERIADAAEFVVIDADLMQLGLRAVEQHLDDDVIGPRADVAVLLFAQHLGVADDVAQIA